MSLSSLHASLLVLCAALGGLGALGCGKEIGDECLIGSDCSPNGDRQCDSSSKGGYCTVQGCDVSTCPEEAVCVRFFTGSFTNKPCDPVTEDAGADACSLDELCSLAGNCVPRSSEIRFCMRTCESDDDCRGGYECRGLEEMKAHGGEPVLELGRTIDASVPRFCAAAPSS
ncbi:MAG TPA: hypothetical protein VNO30_12090 [Kofleriaceae bacterium]|nr:hypothetical protein [Kofleriaceae bacterium]